MKKFSILIVAILCFGQNNFSQETEPIKVKKWTVRSVIFSQPYTFERTDPLPSFFTGIGAKMNFQKISYRASFEHINYKKEIEDQFQKGFFLENTLRLGAEYKMRYYEVINLNFFLDAGVSKISQEATESNLDSNIYVLKQYDGYAVGAIFGIGFDYFLTPNFSVSLETRFDLMNISGNYREEDFLNKYTVNYVTSNSKFNLNILGNFCINYHF